MGIRSLLGRGHLGIFAFAFVSLSTGSAQTDNSFLDRRLSDPGLIQLRLIDQEHSLFSARTTKMNEFRLQNPKAILEQDPLLLSFQSIRQPKGAMSPPVPNQSAEMVLKSFVTDHRDLLGVDPEKWFQFYKVREAQTNHTGVWSLQFFQRWQGKPIFNTHLKANVTSDGAVFNLSMLTLPLDAVSVHLDPIGPASPLPPFAKIYQQNEGYFPISPLKITPAIEIYYDLPGDVRTYRGVFQAGTQQLLFRESMTTFDLPPPAPTQDFYVFAESLTSLDGSTSYFSFRPMDSPQPVTPGPLAPDYQGGNIPPISNQFVVTPWINSIASPFGWTSEINLNGNNIVIYRDWNGDSVADPEAPAVEPDEVGDYYYIYDIDSPTSPLSIQAAQVNAAFAANWFHDRLYEAGFIENFANFQVDNFERGGEGNDPIEIVHQFGKNLGIFNNALFTGIPIDGNFGRVKISLFAGVDNMRDPALDSIVLMHELTHSVVRRLLPVIGLQGDGLNEGWADVIALSLVAFESDPIDGNYPVGSFVSHNIFTPATDGFYFGGRRYPYSTNFSVNPLTLADMDPDLYDVNPAVPQNPQAYPIPYEPHNVGEIWANIMWEVRANLLEKIGFEETQKLFLRLFVDSLKLSPIFPTFTQMRDAVLSAELVNTGGQHQCALWKAFAKRGLGIEAELEDYPIFTKVLNESFEIPLECLASDGDLDGDGLVDAGDLAILLGSWGSSNSIADFDQDGIVNAADLAIFLSYF